jgi:hypothetical protein
LRNPAKCAKRSIALRRLKRAPARAAHIDSFGMMTDSA